MAATKQKVGQFAIGPVVPVRYLLVFWLFILSTVAFLDRTSISIAGVALGQDFALSKVQLGWVFSAFLIGYAGFQIPGGWLSVQLGPRRVLTLGVLWWGVFTALTAMVSPSSEHALLGLLLVRFGLGVGESVVYPAANQFVARWVPVQERGRANGWIFAGVGAGLTPPLLNAIIESHGWRASFWFCAVVGCVTGLVWYAACRDRPEEHAWVSGDELAHIRAGIELSRPGARPAIPWRIIFTNREVWALTISYFTFGVVSGVMNMGCQVGGAITASLTPWIAAQFGWTSAFFVAAALAIVGALAWLLVDPTRLLAENTAPSAI